MDQNLHDNLILLARTRVSISTPDNPAPPHMAEHAKEKLSWEA